MARPAHFEIPVDDPDRAESFYNQVFGWQIQRFEGAPEYYGLAHTGTETPGIDGALYKRGPGRETRLTMMVDSIEDTIAAIKAKGGNVIDDKAAIPGMGWFATCTDTEGNTIGLFTNDPAAA